jgi:hypothetical protein
MRQTSLTTRLHGVCEIVCRGGIVQQISRTTDPERGVRSQRDVSPESRGLEAPRGKCPEPGQSVAMFCHRRSKKTREPRIASVTIPQRAPCRDLTSWRRLVFTVAACAITAVIPDSLVAQRTELEKFIRHRVLSNGLEVIVAQNHGVPLATIEFNVRNGSFTQRPGTEGLAHMYEHMFFKANEQLPEPDAFIQRSSELGASFNGTTQEERVNYYMSLPADSLAGGIKVSRLARSEIPELGARSGTTGGARRIRPERVQPVLRAAGENEQGAVPGTIQPEEHHRGARGPAEGLAGADG